MQAKVPVFLVAWLVPATGHSSASGVQAQFPEGGVVLLLSRTDIFVLGCVSFSLHEMHIHFLYLPQPSPHCGKESSTVTVKDTDRQKQSSCLMLF